jgi:hypothetical protein
MRDLRSRLREIVRREASTPAQADGARRDESYPSPLRELTYVPEPAADAPVHDIARGLGGVVLDSTGACVVLERRYPGDRSHGRRRLESCVPGPGAPLGVLDPRVADTPEWWRRVVFFDIETTGLSGGAGTVAFLAGCGWFDDDGFTVRQFFLAGPSGEQPMLEALGRVFEQASLLVTYNGRTFDVPFMEMRWAFHRRVAPTDELPHFDVLPVARRFWAQPERVGSDAEGCSLSALERRVLGFHRVGDVAGFEIPARYFHFLRSGDASVVEGILDHNRHDLVSLAVVMAHALWLAQEGPAACREPWERVALGRLYERAGDLSAAAQAYEMAVPGADAEVQRQALARLALLHRREARYDAAARAWEGILNLIPRSRRALTSLERRAVEALAIHHEHRARDLSRARLFAERLESQATPREQPDVERRLRRLSRKLQKKEAGGLLA